MSRKQAGARKDFRDAGSSEQADRSVDGRRTVFNWHLRYGPWTVPLEAASDVDDLRIRHDDLDQLEEAQLEAELLAATYVLGARPAHRNIVARDWLLERRGRLRTALRARSGA
jgi:hypothetical protein